MRSTRRGCPSVGSGTGGKSGEGRIRVDPRGRPRSPARRAGYPAPRASGRPGRIGIGASAAAAVRVASHGSAMDAARRRSDANRSSGRATPPHRLRADGPAGPGCRRAPRRRARPGGRRALRGRPGRGSSRGWSAAAAPGGPDPAGRSGSSSDRRSPPAPSARASGVDARKPALLDQRPHATAGVPLEPAEGRRGGTAGHHELGPRIGEDGPDPLDALPDERCVRGASATARSSGGDSHVPRPRRGRPAESRGRPRGASGNAGRSSVPEPPHRASVVARCLPEALSGRRAGPTLPLP